jgi:AcrR family transcriptional regulator
VSVSAEPGHRSGPFAPSTSPTWARLREATIALVLERGLDALDVPSLCVRAGFDPAAFEREFDGVRDCALQVYLANIEEFDRALAAAVDPAEPWRDRLRATAYAAARHVRDRPASTRFDMIAALGLGELAQAHRDRYVRRLVALVDEGRGEMADPEALGPATAEGVFGAVYQQLARELAGGGRNDPARAEQVVPQLMYLAVRPYLGEDLAREELSTPPPEEPER